MDDLMKHKLREAHEEELKDVEKYECMANSCPEYASVFRDIAKEERSHATILQYLIEK